MSHGPRIRPEVRDMIWAEALDRPERRREDVATDLQEAIRGKGYPVPEVETLQKMISKARTSKKPSPEDEPWQLGCLTKQDIPPQALPLIVEMWKLSLVEGKPITIREAKWAARLQPLIGKSSLLLAWSRQYAHRDVVKEAQHLALETSDLDVSLTMTVWEAATAYVTGSVKIPEVFTLPSAPLTSGVLPYVRYSLPDLWLQTPLRSQVTVVPPDLGYVWDIIEREVGDWIQRSTKFPKILGHYRGEIREWGRQILEEASRTIQRCREAFAPSPEAPWVFLYWLAYLKKGPKWANIPRYRLKTVMDRLITWVGKEASVIGGSHDVGGMEDMSLLNPYELRYYGLIVYGPKQLLKAVGYDISVPKEPPSFTDWMRGLGYRVTLGSDAASKEVRK